jgi:hypothetical protein
MKISSIGFIIILLFLAILFVWLSDFITKTVVYKNYLKKCKKQNTDFCGIKKISLAIPQSFLPNLQEISRIKGKRMEVPMKKQKGVSCEILQRDFPSIVHWYLGIAEQVSKELGFTVYPTPLTESNSVSLVVYEKEGDSIKWHFDTNLYEGRYFTLLLPVTFEKTCGSYEYKDADGKDKTVTIQSGEALLFEGDQVFHQGRPICENERRVLLSCTFVTSQKISLTNSFLQKFKNWALYGFNP